MNTLKARIMDRRITRNILLQYQKLSTTASVNSSAEIQVPMRKERGPTDILEALETTISRDPTAADYKFVDDPFLIPLSLTKKRTYIISREAGKRAAMWVRQEHADLLKSDLSQPLVQAFLPIETYNSKEAVSEQILNDLIKQCRIPDVLHIYKLLEKKVSKETKQAILELLCFYNSCTELIPDDFPEEKSYQPVVEGFTNTWVNNPEVEELFNELTADKVTAAGAYNSLICGTAKYYKVERAWQLYNECLSKNIPLAVTTHNYIMYLTTLLKDNTDDRKIMIQTILQNMAKTKVKPNIGTLNAALKSTSLLQSQGVAKDLALSLLTEFKSIGIKPCLASYHYVLLTFCRENNLVSNILSEILDQLEKEELVMQNVADTNFFVQAMEIANKHLHDLAIGNRLHKLLLTKQNYKFIGGRLKESVYYRNYLQLVLSTEDLNDFMTLYHSLVPNVYIPEPALMRNIFEILELVDQNKSMELLPIFLSQVVQFDMLDRYQIMKLICKLMTGHCSPQKDSPLNKIYANMSWTLWTHNKEVYQKRNIQRTMWSASVYGDMAILLIRGNEFEKMLEILHFLVTKLDSVGGSLQQETLLEIFNACIDRGHVPGALDIINYACEFGFVEVQSMSKTIREQLPLSPNQENQLMNLVEPQSLK